MFGPDPTVNVVKTNEVLPLHIKPINTVFSFENGSRRCAVYDIIDQLTHRLSMKAHRSH